MFVLPIAVVLGVGYYLNQTKPPNNVNKRQIKHSRGSPRSLVKPTFRPINPTNIRMHDRRFDDMVPSGPGMNVHPDEVRDTLKPIHRGLQPKGMNCDVDQLDRLRAFDRRLEAFTGTTSEDYAVPKKERLGTIHDTRESLKPVDIRQILEDRTHTSSINNNVLPFSQEKIAPGAGLGYKAAPDDLTEQYLYKKEIEAEDALTADKIRAKNNPKLESRGRITGAPTLGYKPHTPGEYTHKKRKQESESGPASWIRSTGSYLKGLLKPKKVIGKPQWRGLTDAGSYAYRGAGASQDRLRNPLHGKHSAPNRPQYNALGGSSTFRGTPNIKLHGLSDDRGRKSILLRPTHRSHPKYARVRFGNATTQVSALAMPIINQFRLMKRLYDIKNNKWIGNMSGPLKGPVYDPENAKAKTTARETTLTSTPAQNFSGPLKGVVYDPETAAARTTVKETTLTSTPFANLSGPLKGVVYDPDMVAKTTNRETTLAPTPAMNFVGPQKLSVQDGVARTTMRQLLSDVQTPSMNFSGPLKGIVYDPEQVAKTTIKETILTDLRARHGGNIETAYKALGNALYDTRDKSLARKTFREDYDEAEFSQGVQSKIKNLPVYDPDDVPDPTMRDLMGETNYFSGTAQHDVNAPSMRLTNEELEEQLRETMRGLDDIEHYTPAQQLGIGAYNNYTGEGARESARGLQDLLDFRGAKAQNIHKQSNDRDTVHSLVQQGTYRDVASNRSKDRPPIVEGPKTYLNKEPAKFNPHKALGRDNEQCHKNHNIIDRNISEFSRQNMENLNQTGKHIGERTRKLPKWKEDAVQGSSDQLVNIEREAMKKNYKANPFAVPSALNSFS